MPPATKPEPGAARRRLLIADDHPLVREGLSAIVGMQDDLEVVAEAGDGAAALELYRQHRPDLLVLDLRMPRMDGLDVVKAVMQLDPAARILVVTTYDADVDVAAALVSGAKGYLLKDTPRDVVLNAIRIVLDGGSFSSPTVAAAALRQMRTPAPTARELEVLQLLAAGQSNKLIARALDISEGTVKTHVNALLGKLGAARRAELVRIAVERGYVRL